MDTGSAGSSHVYAFGVQVFTTLRVRAADEETAWRTLDDAMIVVSVEHLASERGLHVSDVAVEDEAVLLEIDGQLYG